MSAGTSTGGKTLGGLTLPPKDSPNFPMDNRKPQANKTFLSLVKKWENTGAVETSDDNLQTLALTINTIAIDHLKNEVPGAANNIKEFIEDKRGDNKIDDCVRWHLLLDSVDISQFALDDEPETQEVQVHVDFKVAISKIIIENWPDLAFQDFNVENTRRKYHQKCVLRQLHWKTKGKRVPFLFAAECGNAKAIAAMIEHGKHLQGGQSTLLEAIRPSKSRKSALKLATRANYGSAETLRELLKVDDVITPSEDKNEFNYALNEGLHEVVSVFLEHDKIAEILITSTHIIQALKKVDEVMGSPPRTGSQSDLEAIKALRMVKILISKAPSSMFNEEVVANIIMRGLMSVWEAIPKEALTKRLEPHLLPLAIFYQKHDFVDLFINEIPSSASQMQRLKVKGLAANTSEAKFPLWYNNHSWDASEGHFVPRKRDRKDPSSSRAKIRKMIVDKLIYDVDDMEKLPEILHESNEPFGELCFDISRFNSTSHTISTFVDSVISHGGTRKLLSYEQTLRYVEFPPLDMRVGDREIYKENSHFEQEHTEVFRILDWLREEKHVERIIRLKVPDRIVNPHNDLKMAKEIDRFKVEFLDWKVLDLSISMFSKEVKGRIKELHLYSSSNRAVLSHWFSSEGIKSLKKLETLEIKVIQETCTLRSCKVLIDDIFSQVEILRKEFAPKLKARVESVPWYPTPKLVNLNEITYRIAPKLARWLNNLEVVVNQRKSMRDGLYNPTKVAILDNGILSIPPVSYDVSKNGSFGHMKESHFEDNKSLWSHIQDGRSFVVENSRLNPWQFASDPHGTQMANLICAIDPFCEMYVARVAEDSLGITPDRVAKAIEWAIGMEVDVISMSFALGESSRALVNQMNKATEAGILMTCSTHDEGSRIVDAYPASLKGDSLSLMVLAACDEYGKLLRDVQDEKYHYRIRGQDVAAGIIPFLKSDDTISGSSVSTALAAGLSSLVLTCNRLAQPTRKYDRGRTGSNTRWVIVREHLERMQSSEGSKFILLEKFGKIDTPRIGHTGTEGPETGIGSGPSARHVLTNSFKMKLDI
ncbi:hypothetical protein F4861DRAFT_526015 [Xylaria intraflava]|nr:hypothetical protein F4861DRAFT_526015 [Xylaria intraflava]